MKTCNTCKKQIADSATTCPHCGAKHSTGTTITIAVVIGVVLGALVLTFCTRNIR